MQEEMVKHQPEQLPLIEEMSSPLNDDDQIFDQLCDAEFIQETLQNSEVTSCHREEEEEEKITTYCSISDDVIYTTSTTTTTTTATSNTVAATTNSKNNNNNNNIGQDEEDGNNNNNNVDISASIDFSSSSPDIIDPSCSYFMAPTMFTDEQHSQNMELIISLHSPIPSLQTTTASAYSDPPSSMLNPHVFDQQDCTNLIPHPTTNSSYMSTFNPTSSTSSLIGPPPPPDLFILMNNDIQTQEQLDHKTCLYSSDTLSSCLYNPPNGFCSDNQNLMSAHVNATPPLPTEISNLDDSTYKVGKLSVEQRKEKIHRYMKKRNQRNFNKKIKYACRKTLADSRPRVRGRFAKNDDFGEALRSAVCSSSSQHEDDEKDDVDVKDQDDDILDTSDIFAHISGVNSLQCNFPMIQSWI